MLPLLCYVVIRPYGEIGIDDEWSYVKMAQVFAQTGHIVYNGWPTAMLGWQLYLGAAFIKLFGFSFTTVRLSILPIGMLTAFLLQRSLVRTGLNEWNATVAASATATHAPFHADSASRFLVCQKILKIATTWRMKIPGIFFER